MCFYLQGDATNLVFGHAALQNFPWYTQCIVSVTVLPGDMHCYWFTFLSIFGQLVCGNNCSVALMLSEWLGTSPNWRKKIHPQTRCTPRAHTNVGQYRFSPWIPQVVPAGGRTRTWWSLVFRGLHPLVHGWIPRLLHGADEEACRAAVKELAAALKRSAHGVKLRHQAQAKHSGECLAVGPHGIVISASFQD
jgi:hypothetical protein